MGLPDPNDVAAYDELERRRIGGPQPLTGPIELREYDSRWPGLYAEHAARLRTALGERAVRLEHRLFTTPARDWKYVQQYADAKTGVVEEIMARAMAG